MVDLLEEKGLNCHGATNGHDALRMIDEMKFDMIFMDVKMPEFDGIATYKEIRKRSQETPIVLMSANEIDAHIMSAIREEMVAVIDKPLELKQLEKLLSRYQSIHGER